MFSFSVLKSLLNGPTQQQLTMIDSLLVFLCVSAAAAAAAAAVSTLSSVVRGAYSKICRTIVLLRASVGDFVLDVDLLSVPPSAYKSHAANT
jgi:hypothetical protein